MSAEGSQWNEVKVTMELRLQRDSASYMRRQLSSEHRIHAARTKVKPKLTGEPPNLTSEKNTVYLI